MTWRKPDATEWSKGIRVVLEHFKDLRQVRYFRCKKMVYKYFLWLLDFFRRNAIHMVLSKVTMCMVIPFV